MAKRGCLSNNSYNIHTTFSLHYAKNINLIPARFLTFRLCVLQMSLLVAITNVINRCILLKRIVIYIWIMSLDALFLYR